MGLPFFRMCFHRVKLGKRKPTVNFSCFTRRRSLVRVHYRPPLFLDINKPDREAFHIPSNLNFARIWHSSREAALKRQKAPRSEEYYPVIDRNITVISSHVTEDVRIFLSPRLVLIWCRICRIQNFGFRRLP
mgnify:CR=1 FL=1